MSDGIAMNGAFEVSSDAFADAVKSDRFRIAFPGTVHPVELGENIERYSPEVLENEIAELENAMAQAKQAFDFLISHKRNRLRQSLWVREQLALQGRTPDGNEIA